MPLPWQYPAATDYEEQQLLLAATGGSPNVPGSYYAGVSTTQPTKPGVITELSGNNYARVQIPAWSGAGEDFSGGINAPFYSSPFFTAWSASPLADVIFPAPTSGSWWADGATVYLFLADASSGGNVRWWMPIAPATAPNPVLPLIITSGQLLIGIARQDAGESGAARAVGVLAGKFGAKALDRMTKVDPSWSPTWYLGVGWGDWFLVDGSPFLTAFSVQYQSEPGSPQYPVSWEFAPLGPGNTTFGIGFGSGTVHDGDYVRQSIPWSAPAADADGWYVANSAPISWTLGANTVDSGDPIPPNPILNEQVAWSALFAGLGLRTQAGRGAEIWGGCFTLWGDATGGKGGPPPSLITGDPLDPSNTHSGLADDGHDIWGYPYIDENLYTRPGPLPAVIVVAYPYVEESEIISVTPDGSGLFVVQLPFTYTLTYFIVLYEDDGMGNFVDAISGDVWDPSRAVTDETTTFPPWLGSGTDFPPTGSALGSGYYIHAGFGGGGFAYLVPSATEYNDTTQDHPFAVGDVVTIDTGGLKIRLR